MTSLIAWLDASTEENSKMRELVKLFGTPETTDDLGMGQLRDVISNSLFPGTSVLHLGARYMLLVPWAYLTAHKTTRNPDELRKRAEESERQLIDRLRELNAESYIGSTAGRNVRQLPSAAYWTALRTYGIVNEETDRSVVPQLMCADAPPAEDGEHHLLRLASESAQASGRLPAGRRKRTRTLLRRGLLAPGAHSVFVPRHHARPPRRVGTKP